MKHVIKKKMKVWAFEILSLEIWVVDYLMNIDQKFIFLKSFDVVCEFEIDGKMFWFVFGMIWKPWETILQNLRLVIIFTSGD